MSNFLVELPAELRAEIARRTGHGPAGEAEWVAEAVREKLAACEELDYLEGRAARGSRETYLKILAKIPAVEPTPGDER